MNNAEFEFRRLKWSILDDPSNVQVVDLDDETNEPKWTPLFGAAGTGQPNHPLVDQVATEPPCSRMLVILDEIEAWDFWQDAEAMDDRPAPLIIENTGGEPVTIGQIVTQTHTYAVGLKDVIYEIHDENDPSARVDIYCVSAGLTRSNTLFDIATTDFMNDTEVGQFFDGVANRYCDHERARRAQVE